MEKRKELGILGELYDWKVKIPDSLDHFVMPESKEMLRKKMMMRACQKDIAVNIKVLSMAKMGQSEQGNK